jgi:phage terminase large subunit
VRVHIPYAPRLVFKDFHERSQRWAVLVCHRRAGKTTTLIADMLKRALQGPSNGQYAYIAPYYSQAKSIAWNLLKTLTQDVKQHISESELKVTLMNGATIRLHGADNPDSLRGNYYMGVAIDEYADVKPSLFDEVLRPALADHKGWCVFAGTPKGVGAFKDLYEYSMASDDWFTTYLPVSKTGLLDKAELDDAKSLMSPEVYQQEFECSWTAPRSGSYYGEILEKMADQIGNFEHDPDMPVHCAFDLGWRDSTAVWYWQPRPGGFAIIDHDEANGRTVDDWADILQAKGYNYDKLWLPHDARAKSFQTGRSTIEQMLSYFPRKCAIAPQLSIQQGIDAVRMVLPRCYFNEPTTHVGLRRLKQYGREWNEKAQTYAQNPRHDENSHSADAFRYFALVSRDFEGKISNLSRPLAQSTNNTFQLDVLWDDYDRSNTVSRRI